MLDFKVFDVASQICVAVFTEVIPSARGSGSLREDQRPSPAAQIPRSSRDDGIAQAIAPPRLGWQRHARV